MKTPAERMTKTAKVWMIVKRRPGLTFPQLFALPSIRELIASRTHLSDVLRTCEHRGVAKRDDRRWFTVGPYAPTDQRGLAPGCAKGRAVGIAQCDHKAMVANRVALYAAGKSGPAKGQTHSRKARNPLIAAFGLTAQKVPRGAARTVVVE